MSRKAKKPRSTRGPVAAPQSVATLSRRSKYTVAAVGVLLVLAVALVFGQTLDHPFATFDDDQYIFENPRVAHGFTWDGVAAAFTESPASNWHPLTWLSHMLDCQLYGLEHPGGHHLTSVLLHAASSVLLLLVLWRATGDVWPSALAAALFAVHPLHVESVAWIAERKDVLSGLFLLLTLGAYVRYARHPFSLARYLAVIAMFALGLMAKPMLVTLPLVLLLLDYWPLGRIVAGTLRVPSVLPMSAKVQTAHGGRTAHGVCLLLVVEKIPLLLLSVASCTVTMIAQRSAMAPLEKLTLLERIGNALVTYVAYLGQTVWPAGLALLYPIPHGGPAVWQVAGAMLVLAALTAASLWAGRKYPYVPVGWLWYLGMLVPVIGLVQVGSQSRADRYMYLPQIGIGLIVAWGLGDLARSRPYRRMACAAAAALAVAALTACAWRQASYWRDSESLWNHTIACTKDNFIAYNNLGWDLAKRGQNREAIEHFQTALEIHPTYIEALNNLGDLLGEQGRADEAAANFQKVLELDPSNAAAHSNLALILIRRGKYDEAAVHCRAAVKANPYMADAYVNLGLALGHQGKTEEEIAQYRNALAIDPRSLHARLNLALTLYDRGEVPEAVNQWRAALVLQPDDIAVLNQTAWILATYGDASVRNGAEAVALAQRAVKISSGREPAILGTLAAAEAEAGRFADAVQTARGALALAEQQNNRALAESIRAKLSLYESGSPFHEPPPAAR